MVAQSNVEGNAARHRTRAECPLDDPAPRRQRQPQDPQLPRSPEAPTHFRPFKSKKDFQIINATTSMLEHSGFYWGPMTVEEAHGKLSGEPLGTFLIRDSRQKDVFFTLSYRAASGPISIRINFQGSRFNLFGSKQSFDTLFKLLEYYIASPRRSLTRPYRRVKVQTLQELCRKRIIETCGGENIDSIPVNPVLKDFLNSFPYGL